MGHVALQNQLFYGVLYFLSRWFYLFLHSDYFSAAKIAENLQRQGGFVPYSTGETN